MNSYPRTYDDRMFIETFEHEYTWLNGFMRNVARYSKKRAVIDPLANREWNYAELNAEANRLAHALKEKGLGKNDVVMTVIQNCPEFAFSYIGPRKIGSILLAANFNLAFGEMAKLIDHNRPKAILYTPDVKDNLVKALELCEYPPETIVMADNIKNVEVPEGHIDYRDFVDGKSEENPVKDFPSHIYDEVIRLCTSGTTSLPKSVPLNDINDLLSAHDVIMQYPMNQNDVTMNMTPWFHRGGCHSGGPGPSFYVGAAVVVVRNFVPKQCLKWVEEYGVTFLMGAPASLEMLSRQQERKPADLSGLRGLVTMGAAFEKEACINYLEKLTPNIFNGYGTTETFWNSFLRPYDLPHYAGSAGGSCIDDDVRVVTAYEDGKASPDELVPCDGKTVGEVIIHSPAKSTFTYYNSPEETEKKFKDGWMYTGDLATWDENRYVTLCGRKDDMIVCAAENIYATQVEEVINRHPKVQDSVIIGVPDKLRGQAVAAYIIPEDDSLTVEELAEYCKNCPELSAYKRPRYYRFVASFPRTATGKKMHYKVRQQAERDLLDGRLFRRG